MESYQSWFGEGPELATLRMLGLFDRPADPQTFDVLLKSPAIPGLTESLTELGPTEWQTILAKLRRARLLAILRGWARSASGDPAEGIAWIEQGMRDFRATGSVLGMPIYLLVKAEALHLADRTYEALEAMKEAQATAERYEQRGVFSGLHRLRAVFPHGYWC